jgi:hypothetical protein
LDETRLVPIIHDAKVIGLEVRFLLARHSTNDLMTDLALTVEER